MPKNKILAKFIKRFFDIFASLIALIILSPLFVIISLIIIIDSKGSPFYLSKRLGKNKKEIRIIKFRSMKNNADDVIQHLNKRAYKEYLKNYKLKNDPRITKFGKLLRKSSLDELPQLINILIGDMSIVGPRPIVIDEYNRLWDNDTKIFLMRPGLTGYWGVKGRSLTSYEERIVLEDFYIDNFSIILDIKILLMTIGVVLTGKGAV